MPPPRLSRSRAERSNMSTSQPIWRSILPAKSPPSDPPTIKARRLSKAYDPFQTRHCNDRQLDAGKPSAIAADAQFPVDGLILEGSDPVIILDPRRHIPSPGLAMTDRRLPYAICLPADVVRLPRCLRYGRRTHHECCKNSISNPDSTHGTVS